MGIEYLHFNNVIHRDIKSANILVEQDGTCKLADFGASKQLDEAENGQKGKAKGQFDTFCGTVNWMAPETCKGEAQTRFTDIWSLGCTVIEMITGMPPWSELGNQAAVVIAIADCRKPPPLPQDCSADLESFLNCCF